MNKKKYLLKNKSYLNKLNSVEKWLEDRTLYITKAGSVAYGTNIETSDDDLRGFCVPPLEYFFGLTRFEQSDSKMTVTYFNKLFDRSKLTKPDIVIWNLQKFVDLAAASNPNMLELLYTDPKFHVYVHPLAQELLDCRDYFLSVKIRDSFGGYALDQLKRMRNHKRWMDNPPTHQPQREEFGVTIGTFNFPKEQRQAALALIQRETEKWLVDETDLEEDTRIKLDYDLKRIITRCCIQLGMDTGKFSLKDVRENVAVSELGFNSNFMEALQNEKKFLAALKDWHSYEKWKRERNPVRAELERKFGYDLKHGCNLYRLLDMAEEILTTGKVNVYRPNAEFLKELRYNGIMKYEELIEWAENKHDQLDGLKEKSTLPKHPLRNEISKVLTNIIDEYMNLETTDDDDLLSDIRISNRLRTERLRLKK